MNKKTIAIVTSTRADYSILKLLIQRLEQNEFVKLELIVTGTHLSLKHGETKTEILKDGLSHFHEMDIIVDDDSPQGLADIIGRTVSKSAELLSKLRPDILVLLGDRFEILGVAQAAMLLNVPIGHIHGGECTQGLVDDAVRYSLTKMSHLHFTSTESYRKRVIQLGEDPSRVHHVGAPALELMEQMSLLSRSDLEKDFGPEFLQSFALVTYHPVTLQINEVKAAVEDFFDGLARVESLNFLVTVPNIDTNHHFITEAIEKFKSSTKSQVIVVPSLGALRYFSLMKLSKCVVGNSSSGIIEAPFFKVPTVDVGIRQMGRLAGETVIHVSESPELIAEAVRKAVSPEFKEKISGSQCLYYKKGSSGLIEDVLVRTNLSGITVKKFFDLDVSI